MWGAQFVSNVGGWMQTVAAQWLMLTLTGSAVYVTLVQTAASLPLPASKRFGPTLISHRPMI
jgi:Transmembrane secretion effector